MGGSRKRGEEIRRFILDHVEKHPTDIVRQTESAFGISRKAVHKHVRKLLADKALTVEGTTRDRRYGLGVLTSKELTRPLDGLEEDLVWRNDVAPLFADLPDNVRAIWAYGFTEILNNAIEHSSGSQASVRVHKTAIWSDIVIRDNGEGIFNKIRRELGLDDEHHALLELAKGKLTTDPDHHSGEGIFFSSRMFDYFCIDSGNILFSHDVEFTHDYIHNASRPMTGTGVIMRLTNDSKRTTHQVFDEFSSDDYEFTRTLVPVRFAQYSDETLVSRSQARRLLARFDRFEQVILDFEGVESIGQAFADEVFRVFVREHPNTTIIATGTSPRVEQMIGRARRR
jgi:hypothetical protein